MKLPATLGCVVIVLLLESPFAFRLFANLVRVRGTGLVGGRKITLDVTVATTSALVCRAGVGATTGATI
jgi:hypothetical protein